VRIILDSGAIIASERNDATFAAILKAARKDRTPILLPATVVAETWRGASTHARTVHLFGSVDGFPELNEQTARRVGALLANSRTAEIVDGNVVANRDCAAPRDDRDLRCKWHHPSVAERKDILCPVRCTRFSYSSSHHHSRLNCRRTFSGDKEDQSHCGALNVEEIFTGIEAHTSAIHAA
jgi:predicted nucleic acid-binding protein